MSQPISRRLVIQASSTAAFVSAFMPSIAHGAEPIAVGTLTPNTGGGSPYGAGMATAIKRTADQINAAGGLLGGRMIVLTQEDSETNPETAVRAADKRASRVAMRRQRTTVIPCFVRYDQAP